MKYDDMSKAELIEALESLSPLARSAWSVEEAYTETDARLRHVLASCHTITYRCELHLGWQPEQDFTPYFVSENITRILGYVDTECVNRRRWWLERIHPADEADVLKRMETLLEDGYLVYEYRFRHRSGQYLWLRDEPVVVRDENGNPLEIVGSWEDITQRREAEDRQLLATRVLRELNQSKRELTTIRNILSFIKEAFDYDIVAVRLRQGEGFPDLSASGYPVHFVGSERYIRVHDPSGDPVKGLGESPEFESRCADVLCGRANPVDPRFTDAGSYWINGGALTTVSTGESSRLPRRSAPSANGRGSCALVPLRSEEEIVGVFEFRDRRSDLFEASTIAFFEDLGNSIGVTLARLRVEQARSSSEDRYRKLFEQSNDAVLLHGIDGRILDANDRACELLGCTAEELAEMRIRDLHPPHQKPGTRKDLKRGDATGSVRFETQFRKVDGSVVDVEVSSRVVNHQEGIVQGVVRDITERKKAERALRESEARYRALFLGSADGILIADAKTRTFTYANPAICEMLGYSEGELLKKRVEDLHPADSLDRVLREFEAQAAGQITLARDIPCLRADGSVVYADINSAAVTLDGRTCLVGYFRDNTERRRMLSDLRMKEHAIASSINGIAIADLDGNLAHVNPAIMEMWGYDSAKEILGKPAHDFFEKPEAIQEIIRTIRRTGHWRGELTARHADGTLFQVQAGGNIVTDHAGRPVSLMGSFVDVSNLRRMERSYRDSTRLLKQTQMQLAQAGRMAALGQLAAGIAHELNTPLNGIASASETLHYAIGSDRARGNGSLEETLQHLRSIEAGVFRCQSIVESLLHFAGRDDQEPDLETNMRALLADAMGLVRADARAREREMLLEPKEDAADLIIHTQPKRLQQVFLNLLLNALDATEKGDRIRISAKREGESVSVRVSDSGRGIAPADLKRVFRPFFTTKPAGQATGLGLHLCRWVLESLGGRIAIDSKLGESTTVAVWVPRRRSE